MIRSSALATVARTPLKRYVSSRLAIFLAVLRRIKKPKHVEQWLQTSDTTSPNPTVYESKRHPQNNLNFPVRSGGYYWTTLRSAGTLLKHVRLVAGLVAKRYSTQALTDYDGFHGSGGNGTAVDDLSAIGYDSGCLSDECIVNIYLDTEQSKIEERANFIGFLQELIRSGGVDDDVKRKIEVFLDSKRYEAVVETQF